MKYKSFLIVFMALCCLAIMAQQEKKHTIQRGETIESIAKKYDITVTDLQEANPNLNKFFFVGMKINIPSKTLSESAKKEPIVLSKGNENIGLSEQKAGNEPESNEFTPLPAGNNRVDEQKNNTVVLAEKTISQKEEVSVVFSNPESIVDSSDLKEDTKVELNSSQISQVQNEMDTKSDELDSAIIGVEDTKLLYKLIDDYVVSYKNGENTTPYQKKLIQRFMKSSPYQQESILTNVFDRMISIHISENNEKTKGLIEKMALIEIYTLLADEDDSRLCDVFFNRGEISGLCTGDTVMLKDCITELKLSDQSKTQKVTNYISTLQDYLEQIRNYLPASKRMDGVWVSEIMYNMDYVNEVVYYTPSFTINVNHGQVKLENTGYAINFANIGFWSNKVKNDENTYAQSVIDIGKDKVYLVWSNEKLKIPNQAVALSLGQTVGDVTTNAVTEATSSLIGNIGGDMVGGIAGNIIGGAIMDLFAPSKKMYILEMELELINDYELIGRQCLQVIKIDGNGKPDISTEKKEIYFVKYDIKSGVYFGSSGNKYKYVPGFELSKEFPSQYRQMFTDLAKKYQKGFYSHKNGSFVKFQSNFCPHQIKKLIYYNDQKMLREGCKMSEKWHQYPKRAYLGVYLEPIDKKKKYKIPNNIKGVYIYDVDKAFPAYLFGIKKGDIILSADGFEMDNYEQFLKYLNSLHPYEWIVFHIKRGNKEIDIKVELTWVFRKED